MRDYDAIRDPNVSAATPKAVILRTSQPTSEFASRAAFHDCDPVRVDRLTSRKIRRRTQFRLATDQSSQADARAGRHPATPRGSGWVLAGPGPGTAEVPSCSSCASCSSKAIRPNRRVCRGRYLQARLREHGAPQLSERPVDGRTRDEHVRLRAARRRTRRGDAPAALDPLLPAHAARVAENTPYLPSKWNRTTAIVAVVTEAGEGSSPLMPSSASTMRSAGASPRVLLPGSQEHAGQRIRLWRAAPG
jgi:hypothetical protein